MSELSPAKGRVLSQALAQFVGRETGHSFHGHDVSRRQFQWDFEVTGHSLRGRRLRISHVTNTNPVVRQASAEICREIMLRAEHHLATAGVRDFYVSFTTHSLPSSRAGREKWVQRLAHFVASSIASQSLVKRGESLEPGFNGSLNLPDLDFFGVVRLYPKPGLGPAKMFSASDPRLATIVPPLYERVLPTIKAKEVKHGILASSLHLVVELVDGAWSAAELAQARRRIRHEACSFRGVLVAWFKSRARVRIVRLS